MMDGTQTQQLETRRHLTVQVAPRGAGMSVVKDFGIPMADGSILSANRYLPQMQGPVPIIMAMTIYRKELHEVHYRVFDAIPNTHLGVMCFSEDATFEGPDPAFWVPHGYGVIHVDVRGFGKSPGRAAPFSKQAFEDFRDAIEWVANQPWSNGKVALSGVSYLGLSQYFVAALAPKGLVAINPWDARTDRFRSDYLGGIPNTVMSRYIFENFTIPSLNDPGQADTLRAFTDMAAQPRLITDPVHAERIAMMEGLKNVTVPTLIGGSFSDQGKHSRDAFENYMRIGSKDKYLFAHRDGEWGAYYDPAGLALQRRFFDHFVKGVDNGWDVDQAPISLRIHRTRTAYHMRTAANWPIPETDYRIVHLAGSEQLAAAAPGESGMVEYDSNTGAAHFDMVAQEPMDIAGHIALTLWVELTEGEDTDLFVGLSKLDREGNTVHFLGESGNNPNDIVSRGWLRLSHRGEAPESKPWRPVLAHTALQPVQTRTPVRARVEIHPTAVHLEPGETLRLIVSGRSIQPADLAMGFEERINSGNHRIHFGGAYDSALSLPVIPASKSS
ncbi:MAG: CocE/NonD family hydrolase [Devosia sp.]|nr:CocE/NonD family hydrolase [Devosia sp.]